MSQGRLCLLKALLGAHAHTSLRLRQGGVQSQGDDCKVPAKGAKYTKKERKKENIGRGNSLYIN
eukprot:917290-Pelagomonas_calceolata.AAC.3